MKQDLPLYQLFCLLKNEGFSLGTQQYLLLIKALHAKKNLQNLEAIRRTCHALWTNSEEEKWIFDRHFDWMIRTIAKNPASPIQQGLTKGGTNITTAKEDHTAIRDQQLDPTNSPLANQSINNPADLPKEKEIPIQQSSAQLPGTFTPFSGVGQDLFLIDQQISPITLRQMQQSWRYLRLWRREGAQTELDLDKTIEKVAQRGFFQQPEYSAPRINAIDLLLLVDRNGSMLPFHDLLDELLNSAINGGRFHKVRSLFFHDYPLKYLYSDPQLLEEIKLDKLELDAKNTVVMIISDAGAARQTYSEKRIQRTTHFLDYLKQGTARQVWLNPLPRNRWRDSSAEDIAEQIIMKEITPRGLSQAIEVLRGKAKKNL